MLNTKALGLEHLALRIPAGASPNGQAVLAGIFAMATSALFQLHRALGDARLQRGAAISRIRGTGPGVSFGRLISVLEADHPITLSAPFEQSPMVTGAAWLGSRLLQPDDPRALLKLRFEFGAVDLPLHTHERSDRFIMVLEGRGYFHVCNEPLSSITEECVRTVPVRSRDVLMFTKGTVHTFSAPHEPLVLLSFHEPYIDLDDPDQYTVPSRQLLPRQLLACHNGACVACDPAWNVMACWPGL